MNDVPFTMRITSESAGRYAPPAMHWPITAAICGMRKIPPHDRVVIEDAARAELSGKDAALIRQVHTRPNRRDTRSGCVQRIAISCARRIFLIVSGHHEPAFTVASLATMTTLRPSTTPIPVTTPADGACPSYWSYATSRPISTKRVLPIAEQRDALARGELSRLVQLLDLRRAATDLELRLELAAAPRRACGAATSRRLAVASLEPAADVRR